MPSSKKHTPKYLGQKLLQVRLKLELTQEGMADLLTSKALVVQPGHVSRFETGIREPSLPMLLTYTRLAKVPMETLVDDELKLPKDFPEVARTSNRVRRSPRTHD